MRESPALSLMELLMAWGRRAYHDPYVQEIPPTREYSKLAGLRSEVLNDASIAGCDAVLISTDHDAVDYAAIRENARLICGRATQCHGAKRFTGTKHRQGVIAAYTYPAQIFCRGRFFSR